jgi:sirohydrochlorin cobaltochelatase
MIEKNAVMLCGHGSRDVDAVDEFHAFSRLLRDRLSDYDVESGFLEFARPVIRDGLEALKGRGAERIICLPGMLFAAGHVKNDVPSEVNAFAARNPDLEVLMGRDLGIDAKLLRASEARIESTEGACAEDVARADTVLLVVGRGTNDPDANANVSKVARMLWEGMGFGWAEVAYSGVTYPLVDAALNRAARLGFARIIVFPYFLFTGVLVKRIYAWADAAAERYRGIEIVNAPYLNDHPLVVDCFVDRVHGALAGDDRMNCRLCKYREQIIGYEDALGTPQAGHHHHVRGIGTDAGHHHPHGHDHDLDQGGSADGKPSA